MPKPKRRSDKDGVRVDELLDKARNSVLSPDELKEILWILAPVTDLPSIYWDGEQFYFDAIAGQLYKVENGRRLYVWFFPDDLTSFFQGGAANKGGGQFARLAPTSSKLSMPLPAFPKVPPNVKAKFPELKESWDKWEESVEQWVQHVQQQLS